MKSTIDSLINNEGVKTSSPVNSSAKSKDSAGNAIWVAFAILVSTVNTKQQSLVVQAKQLQINSNQQVKLNNEIINLKNYYARSSLFQTKAFKHTYSVTTWSLFGIKCKKTYVWYTRHLTCVNPNELGVIQEQEQRENGIRQGLQSQLALLRQSGQTSTGALNTETNNTESGIQMCHAFLQQVNSFSSELYKLLMN